MDKNILFLDSPASEWELASPIGNGYSGAMIYGGVSCEQIQLTEESIWSGGKPEASHSGFRTKIDKIRELFLAEKSAEAESYAAESLKGSFIRIKSQETAGDVFIEFGEGDFAGYRRELDLLNGISTVSFTRDGEKQVRETFASYPDRVIAARHTGKHSARISYKRFFSSPKTGPDLTSDRFGVKSVKISGDTMTVNAAPAVEGKEFFVKLRIVTDGSLTTDGETFIVTDAFSTEYYFAIGVGYVPELPTDSYDVLKKRSTEDFSSLMGRSDISFGEDALSEMSADKRIERLKADKSATDTGLTSLYFRFGKYLLVASSRKGSLPANLQGVWNCYTAAPWNSDYHTNINLQMNYWNAEPANLTECTEPLFNYMNKYLLESGRETASELYKCRGTVVHHLSDIYGFTLPADALLGLWPMGGAWLCYSMWEHFLYTRDCVFLRETAYEYICDCARFFLDYMFEDSEGRLLSGPSTSPENRYICGGKPTNLCLSPSMDIEIISGLLNFYMETEEILCINPALADEARAALKKIPPLKVGKHGQLMEWLEDYDEAEPGHRHISHLFALYPDCAISQDTPDLFAASKKTLERRLANGGGHTGWSCAWLTALFARLCDKEGVSSMIYKLFTKSPRGNLFDSHPPFQIDGNFGASAAIIEMLIQSHKGKIVLLPACPDECSQEGSFTRLCVRGGAEISAAWKNGKVISCSLTACHGDYNGVVIADGTEYTILLKQGETVRIV